jgi:hypothetical protein
MTATLGWLRRQLPGIVALVLVAGLFVVSRVPFLSEAEAAALASNYRFEPQSIALPSGYPQHEIRQVNKAYKKIDAWISSVGAGIALNDLDGDGLANDLVVTDTRIDQTVITPAPGKGSDRYAPFAVNFGNLPITSTMAPMGSLPGDFNEDGRTDLLVYFWGRTPILLLHRPNVATLSANAFMPVELVHDASKDGKYVGPLWNSNTAAFDDLDGDGHGDLVVGNYFPDSPVLDPNADGGVSMNHSLAQAFNGGEDHVFRFTGLMDMDGVPCPEYQEARDVLPEKVSKAWGLGLAANDLDGDGLPELYFANDHGPDALLYNQSTPGHLKFSPVKGDREADVPKSKRVGADSFKGMGIDFADFDHNGLYDMFISNITTSYGIQESNLQFMNTAKDQADLRNQLKNGDAPWKDRSTDSLTAWGGWCWDVKMADFNNSGDVAIAQTDGFVKGLINRWPQLQEMATANDQVLSDPAWWPNVGLGDDIAGGQRMNFFVRGADGKYANISEQLGLAVPVPTRGIAIGDTDGDGNLDFAVARQWDQPVFYHNAAPSPGSFLGLRLFHDTAAVAGAAPAPGSPAVGTQITVTTPDGRKFIDRVDGGSGHSGKRSNEVHIGLGNISGPVQVHLQWRDRSGALHQQDLQLTTGWHTLQLGSQAKER